MRLYTHNMKARAAASPSSAKASRAFSLLRATSLTPPLLAFAVAHGEAPFDVRILSMLARCGQVCPTHPGAPDMGQSFSARVRRTFTAAAAAGLSCSDCILRTFTGRVTMVVSITSVYLYVLTPGSSSQSVSLCRRPAAPAANSCRCTAARLLPTSGRRRYPIRRS